MKATPALNAQSGHGHDVSQYAVKAPTPAANTAPAIAPTLAPNAWTASEDSPPRRRRRPTTYTTSGAIATLTTSGYVLTPWGSARRTLPAMTTAVTIDPSMTPVILSLVMSHPSMAERRTAQPHLAISTARLYPEVKIVLRPGRTAAVSLLPINIELSAPAPAFGNNGRRIAPVTLD